jgi:hypothetical protein
VQKWVTVTNTLAYYIILLITTVNSFIVQATIFKQNMKRLPGVDKKYCRANTITLCLPPIISVQVFNIAEARNIINFPKCQIAHDKM